MLTNMKNFLLYIWQLPQTVFGWLLIKIYGWEYRERKRFPNVHIYFCPKFHSAISLGKYIIINPKYNGETMSAVRLRHHEYGHCLQSQMLGWFYLPVVGIWSAIRAIFVPEGRYYDAFPEDWADKLGGVKRNENGERYV